MKGPIGQTQRASKVSLQPRSSRLTTFQFRNSCTLTVTSQGWTPPFQGGDRRVEYSHDTIQRYTDDAPVLAEPVPLIQPLVPSQNVTTPFIAV